MLTPLFLNKNLKSLYLGNSQWAYVNADEGTAYLQGQLQMPQLTPLKEILLEIQNFVKIYPISTYHDKEGYIIGYKKAGVYELVIIAKRLKISDIPSFKQLYTKFFTAYA